MAEIGNWGKDIKFSVNSMKQLTFTGFQRSVSGRWTKHSILNRKPKVEFQGPDTSSVPMELVLAASHGVRPRNTIRALERACENGTAAYLFVGGKKVGSNKMYLESINETWDEIWNKGELARATLSLTFSEYT